MLEKIKMILSEFTEFDVTLITQETSLTADFGFNSFEVLNIVTAFEDAFDVEIADRDIRTLATVGDVIAYIEAKA